MQYKRRRDRVEMALSIAPILSQLNERLLGHERCQALIMEARFAPRAFFDFGGKPPGGARLRPFTARQAGRNTDHYQFGIVALDDLIKLLPTATLELDGRDRAGAGRNSLSTTRG